METRVALIGIIIENTDAVDKINNILHQYRDIVIGRMGVPYRPKNISVISVCLDASDDVINAISGKIGNLPGVTAKTVYSNVKCSS